MALRLAWLTDIHLNWVERPAIEGLARDIQDAQPDAVLIGGDIGHATDVVTYLQLLHQLLRLPIFFVLGNHDYYYGAVASLRAEVRALVDRTPDLTWLSVSGPVSLTADTALVGHDGWGDGGFGNARGSPVILSDFLLIEDLQVPDRESLLAVLGQLGDEAAMHLRRTLTQAVQDRRHVVALTHVPPFREAAWHQGRESDENWLPFFSCKSAGDALREVMAAHPRCHLKVLCGHTHGAGRCRPASNIEVITGGAEYGHPCVDYVVEVP